MPVWMCILVYAPLCAHAHVCVRACSPRHKHMCCACALPEGSGVGDDTLKFLTPWLIAKVASTSYIVSNQENLRVFQHESNLCVTWEWFRNANFTLILGMYFHIYYKYFPTTEDPWLYLGMQIKDMTDLMKFIQNKHIKSIFRLWWPKASFKKAKNYHQNQLCFRQYDKTFDFQRLLNFIRSTRFDLKVP